MILAIDIGNTNTHLGFFTEKDKCIANETIPNSLLNTTFLEKVIKINGGKKIISVMQNILFCSTCPKIERIVIKWSQKVFKIKPLKAGKDFPIPIINRTTEPECVGKDRLLNALAAWRMVGGKTPVLVISCGTAITFDIVSKKGEFLGGVIAPGLNTMAKSLSQNCALLPLVKIPNKKSPVIGKNTLDAISSGVYFGAIGLVKNITQELVRTLRINHSKLRIIVTGGDAGTIKSGIPFRSEVIPYLTLRGLVWAYSHSACPVRKNHNWRQR